MILTKFSTGACRRVTLLFSLTMAESVKMKSSVAGCKRLMNIDGSEGKQNDVIVCGAEGWKHCKQHIIFFGGDVQNFKEEMESHYTNKAYAQWDLESTAQLLQSKFPDSVVFVIKPSEMLLKTFSMYKNFLNFDIDAKPEFTKDHGALVHLAKLYAKAVENVESLDGHNECSVRTDSETCSSGVEIKILGFSKGCVVLNQLMFELNHFKDDEVVKGFLERVSAFYWLDGGHTGGIKAYITDDDVVQDIANLGKDIFVLVTPYQIKDFNRRWIGKEEAEFVKKLKALGAKIKEVRFYMDVPGCIDNHFKILTKVR